MSDNSAAATADNIRHAAANAARTARDTISDAVSDVADSFKETVNDRKVSGADAVSRLARSTREAADNLKEDAPQIAGAVSNAAGKVEQISNDIREMSMNELLDSASDFARRHPVALVGAGILAGMLAARLLKPRD